MTVRVLVQIRTNQTHSGGDTLHAERKAAELRRLGIEVDVTGEWAADPSGYDLVHLYNTQVVEPTLRRALRARGCGVPVVIETIYWDTAALHAPVTYLHEEGLRHVALALADRAIPSSSIEATALERRYPQLSGRLRVVPVGVDSSAELPSGDGGAFRRRHRIESEFVLCAGRKEPRKNQLALIRACDRLGVNLVLAGAEHPEHGAYVEQCRAAAATGSVDVRFLPHLDHPQLAGAYAAAAVHVQPSISESVGLSSLEAALAGCKVVATRDSGISEYLGGDAWYCNPWSVDSIADAIAQAKAAPAPDGLPERLRGQFSWRRAAEETLVVYEEAMREHEQRDGGLPIPAPQYTEHLEELVQLQLEAIAMRDQHLDGVQAEVGSLEAQLAQARADSERARAEVAHADDALRRAQADSAAAQADSAAAQEHLELLYDTRLLRWTAPARALYERARRRG